MSQVNRAYLVLEDGSWYEGDHLGYESTSEGEVVFTTSMTGYQEMLTDPSFSGQLVMPTYPLIGNYGINLADVESDRIQVAGFIVRDWSEIPSHGLAVSNLHNYLTDQKIPGITGIDTRSLTRKLRTHGVMMGIITSNMTIMEASERLHKAARYGSKDHITAVTTRKPYSWNGQKVFTEQISPFDDGRTRITVIDFGVKTNILRILHQKGARTMVVSANATADQILATGSDGVILSPGPGDPAVLDYAVETVRKLQGRVPLMGICLGHQVIARSFGAKTYKLKFGHRGANHPVREQVTGTVHITAQNHGYSVDADSLSSELNVSHISLTDGTVEGLVHASSPIITIQYHSEASPGPHDNEYLFDRFIQLTKAGPYV